MDKFELEDRVKNIINGKIGEVTGICRMEYDVNKADGQFSRKYYVNYSDGTRLLHTIVEIEKIQSILDEKEKEYLSAVIRPFRKNVKWICKRVSPVTLLAYIRIKVSSELDREDYVTFPYFNLGKMYKGMKNNKEYTLKELEL